MFRFYILLRFLGESFLVGGVFLGVYILSLLKELRGGRFCKNLKEIKCGFLIFFF